MTQSEKEAATLNAETLSVERDSKRLDYRPGMLLEDGDIISTGPDTSAVVHIADASVVLTSNSKVTLGWKSIKAWLGEVFVSGWLGTETELATAGVEGTEYVVKVDKSKDMTVTVLEGHVRLTVRKDPTRSILLQAGQLSALGDDSKVVHAIAGQPLVAIPLPPELFNALIAIQNSAQEPS